MKKLFTVTVITLLVAFLLLSYSLNVNSSLSQSIVRLHVIANSESEDDQLLKLKVRDAILAHSSADFTKKADVSQNLDIYRSISEDVIRRNGYNYDVCVEYGNFHFPTKHYENLSLPAGNYDAVRITIGSGKGKNWWCILFPPLCYINGSTNTSEASNELQKILSKDNYDLISTQIRNGRVPVEIKFKIVEICGQLTRRSKIYAKIGKDKTNENESKRAS